MVRQLLSNGINAAQIPGYPLHHASICTYLIFTIANP